MTGMIHDPEAEQRSIMMKRPALCNGQKTGRSCAFYWVHTEKVESNNPDNLRLGEIFRGCILHDSIVHEMSESQLATSCNQYKPRKLPLFRRALAVLNLTEDPGKYDPTIEEYQPLSPEEIRELQKGSSDPLGRDDDAVAGGVPGQTAPLTDDMLKALNGPREVSADEALAALDEDADSPD